MRLWIKGKPQAALDALSAHRLTAGVHEMIGETFQVTESQLYNETIAHVSDTFHEEVAKWFLEHKTFDKGYGYEDGTLLYYVYEK